jgi:hypothetical protein
MVEWKCSAVIQVSHGDSVPTLPTYLATIGTYGRQVGTLMEHRRGLVHTSSNKKQLLRPFSLPSPSSDSDSGGARLVINPRQPKLTIPFTYLTTLGRYLLGTLGPVHRAF